MHMVPEALQTSFHTDCGMGPGSSPHFPQRQVGHWFLPQERLKQNQPKNMKVCFVLFFFLILFFLVSRLFTGYPKGD